MAYAMLAGMPPIYGLYGGLVPLIIYALFASSTKMSVGPVAISSLLILSGVSVISEPGSPEYIQLVLAAGLIIGLIQAVLGFFRLGFVVNFLSHAVIVGFTSAAAIIILVSQLKDALGFHIPNSSQLYDTISYAIKNMDSTNLISLSICLVAIIIIYSIKKIGRSIPGPLIVVILAIALSYFFNFEEKGVEVVGNIPKGLPEFQTISLTLEQLKLLVPTILTVSLIGIVESMGIAKAMEARYSDHTIYPNVELRAIGYAKIVGAFFQAMPSSGSFTRSAINAESGAKTMISSLVTAIIVVLTILYLTGVFYYLPKPILAGIILVSIFSLFNIKQAKYIYRVSKTDFIMLLITFLTTLFLGIEFGVAIGVLFSVLAILYKISKPNIVTLGRLPGTNSFKDVCRFAEAEESEEIVIFRFENQLFFANASTFRDKVLEYIDTRPKMRYLLLDARLIHEMDSHGTHILKEVDELLKSKNIELHMCGAIGPVRDRLYRSNLLGESEKHHLNVLDAVERVTDPSKNDKRKFRATQKNIND